MEKAFNRQEYNALPGINFSLLKKYMQSPAHFYHAWTNQEEDKDDTRALLLGKAIHCLVLEPHKFTKQFTYLNFADAPVQVNAKGEKADYRTKANSEWKKGQIEIAKMEGKTMLESEDDYQMILAMGNSVKTNKAAFALLQGCANEEVIEWVDQESGVPCKAIVDFNNKTKYLHGDLKSMEDASPDALQSFISKWMTPMQLAFYADGLESKYGKPFDSPFIVAIEKQAPYVCQPYFLDIDSLQLGRTMYKSLLNIHAKCVEKQEWLGYSSMYENTGGVMVTKLTGWAMARAEGNEMLQNN